MSLKEWLNRPYPLIEKAKDKTILVAGFALFTYLFLLFYEPFNTAEIKVNKAIYLAGFGFCVGLALSINYFLLPAIMPRGFHAETWQIKKEIIYLLWSFLFIAILNYIFNTTFGQGIAPQHSVLKFLGKTISIGMFPLLALLYFTERYLSNRNEDAATVLDQQLTKSAPKSIEYPSIVIQPDTLKSPRLELQLKDFLFAASDNNYTTFYFFRQGALKREMLRISMKKVEEQLRGVDQIIRCHRSYLVNKLKIQHVRGNARSINLQLEHYDGDIPVSRSFPKEQLLL